MLLTPDNSPAYKLIGGGYLLAVPFSILLAGGIFALTAVLTRKTALGTLIESLGVNPEASRLAGVRARPIIFLAYVFSGLCAGLAGLMLTSNSTSADPNSIGLFIELDAILAVVIGGTSLAGGRFSLAFALHYSRFGRTVYAVGGNEPSARLMGLRVDRTKISVYVISGFCAGIAGLLFAFYTASGDPVAGIGYELNAIAAVVIGGTLLSGGSGYVLGSMLGVLVLATIYAYKEFDGDLNTGWTRVMIGVLVLFFIRVATSRRHPTATMTRADAALAPAPPIPRREGTQMSTPPRARPPGLYDVARLAGVSHQTVSRVVNPHPSVREETRLRVQQAIAQLGYRRNVAARTLVTRRSNIIGVITSVSPFWGPSSTLIGVERAARDAGFYLSVAGLHSIEPTAVKDVLGHFGDQGVEGIVVIAPEAALAHMADPFITDVPVVMVAAGAEPATGVQITAIDQERGARLATRHLIELGHTRIGHIAGPEPWFDATARLAGWRRELSESGLRPGPHAAGDWTAASGHRIGMQWFRRKRLPSAIFVANDLMALGFIRAMHDAGIRVPEDISIVGFDDMPGADHFLPGLTTVRQDLDTLGQQCIEMLVAALNHTAGEIGLVEPTLIVRESAAQFLPATPGRAEAR